MHRACRRASDDAIARCEERATAFHAHSHARVPLPTFMAHPVASRVESSEGRKVEPGRLLIVIQYGTCWERNIDGAQCLPNRGLSTLPHRPRREPASQQLEEALRAPSTLPQLAVGRSTSLGSQGPAKCLASTFAPVIPVPSDLPVNGVPSTHPGAGCEGETGLTGQTDISPTVLGVCRWPSSDATRRQLGCAGCHGIAHVLYARVRSGLHRGAKRPRLNAVVGSSRRLLQRKARQATGRRSTRTKETTAEPSTL